MRSASTTSMDDAGAITAPTLPCDSLNPSSGRAFLTAMSFPGMRLNPPARVCGAHQVASNQGVDIGFIGAADREKAVDRAVPQGAPVIESNLDWNGNARVTSIEIATGESKERALHDE